jgi:hypothetical protein
MTPPKFDVPGQYVWVTRQGQRCKERMPQPENVVELEDVTTSDTKSISPTWVEEETSTTQQGEIGQSSGAQNGILNPNPEMPANPDETMGPRQSHEGEEVLVEDITNRPEFEREEEDADKQRQAHLLWDKKERCRMPWILHSPISQTQ